MMPRGSPQKQRSRQAAPLIGDPNANTNRACKKCPPATHALHAAVVVKPEDSVFNSSSNALHSASSFSAFAAMAGECAQQRRLPFALTNRALQHLRCWRITIKSQLFPYLIISITVNP